MSRFRPADFAEAAANRAASPARPRKPMSKGTKGLKTRSLAHNAPENGQPGKTATGLSRSGIDRKKATGTKGKGKRKKLPGIKSLRKRAWAQFSIWIRLKNADSNGYVQCVTCEISHPWNSGLIHAGHWIHGRLDFDERNVHPQCRNDNFFTNTRVNTAYSCFMAKTYGAEVMDELRLLSNTKSNKYSRDELNGLIARYKTLNAANPLVREQ